MLARLRSRIASLAPWQGAVVLAVLPFSAILAFVLLWAFTRKHGAAALEV